MTDFVVFCFVSIVVVLLFLSAATIAIISVTDPGRDQSAVVNAISDIITTLIGALVGFIAGKGSGRAEVHDEQAELKRHEKEITK
jgi:hypothetical protein